MASNFHDKRWLHQRRFPGLVAATCRCDKLCKGYSSTICPCFSKDDVNPPKKSCWETWVRCWWRCLLVSDFWIFFLIGTFPKLVFSTKQVFLWLECHIQMWQHSRQFSSSQCGSYSVIFCTKFRRPESWPLKVAGKRRSAILVGPGIKFYILRPNTKAQTGNDVQEKQVPIEVLKQSTFLMVVSCT